MWGKDGAMYLYQGVTLTSRTAGRLEGDREGRSGRRKEDRKGEAWEAQRGSGGSELAGEMLTRKILILSFSNHHYTLKTSYAFHHSDSSLCLPGKDRLCNLYSTPTLSYNIIWLALVFLSDSMTSHTINSPIVESTLPVLWCLQSS